MENGLQESNQDDFFFTSHLNYWPDINSEVKSVG